MSTHLLDYEEVLGELSYECPLNPEHLGYWEGPLPSRFKSGSFAAKVDDGFYFDKEMDEVLFEVSVIGNSRGTYYPLQAALLWEPEYDYATETIMFPLVFIPVLWLDARTWTFSETPTKSPVQKVSGNFFEGLWQLAEDHGKRESSPL